MKNRLSEFKEIFSNKINTIKENNDLKKMLNKKYIGCFLLVVFIFIIASNIIVGNKKSNLATFDMQGEITFIQNYDINQCIFVENYDDSKAIYKKAYVNITDETIIQNQGSKKKLSIKDLKMGDYIKVVFEENIIQTYPVQANAKIIEIVNK